MAAAALERQAEKGRAEGRHPVVDVGDAILLLDRATLRLLLVEPVEGGGQSLLVGGVWQQVAGELPAGEVVPGEVVVERPDHPVSPGPHGGPFAIDLKAIAVGVAGEVEPVGGHPLAVARTGQQAVEEPFVGIGMSIGQEGFDLGHGRGKAREIKTHPADQRRLVSLGLKGETSTGEAGGNDRVDRLRRGQLGPGGLWRHKRPVRLVGGSRCDPRGKLVDISRGETAELGLGGRHDDIGVV